MHAIDALWLAIVASTPLLLAVEGEVRSYRVSRIQEVKITDQPCVRPVDFDLAAFWEESSAKFKTHLPKYIATLRARASVGDKFSLL